MTKEFPFLEVKKKNTILVKRSHLTFFPWTSTVIQVTSSNTVTDQKGNTICRFLIVLFRDVPQHTKENQRYILMMCLVFSMYRSYNSTSSSSKRYWWKVNNLKSEKYLTRVYRRNSPNFSKSVSLSFIYNRNRTHIIEVV